MKLALLLTTMALLSGCPPKKPVIVANGDSPVVVADGSSLHVRVQNQDYIRVHSTMHASVDLGELAVSFEVVGCTAAHEPGCNANANPKPSLLNASATADLPWTLTLNDGTVLSMDPNGNQPNKIDVMFNSAVTIEDPVANGDGVGLWETSANLSQASLSINGGSAVVYTCPTTPPKDPPNVPAVKNYCRMKIHYCGNANCN
jgi:hypothetical protein